MLPVTSIAAVAAGGLFVGLTLRVVARRRAERVAIGTGGDALNRAIRVQGNFAECAPLVLTLLGLAELNGAPTAWLAGIATVFLAGRVAHAYSLSHAEVATGTFFFRVAAMVVTLTAIGLLGATILLSLAIG